MKMVFLDLWMERQMNLLDHKCLILFFSPVEEAPVAEEATPEPKAVTEKEYKYLKDVELFYEELMVRNSPKMESREQMSVEVKSYEDYRNLWAGITANGKVPEAMQNIYFIKDGKRYNVKPPKPKVDENGNVVDMNLPQTLREYLLKNQLKKKQKQRLSLLLKKRLNYLKSLQK